MKQASFLIAVVVVMWFGCAHGTAQTAKTQADKWRTIAKTNYDLATVDIGIASDSRKKLLNDAVLAKYRPKLQEMPPPN